MDIILNITLITFTVLIAGLLMSTFKKIISESDSKRQQAEIVAREKLKELTKNKHADVVYILSKQSQHVEGDRFVVKYTFVPESAAYTAGGQNHNQKITVAVDLESQQVVDHHIDNN